MVDFFVRVIIGSHHQLGEFDEMRGKEAFPCPWAGISLLLFSFSLYAFDNHDWVVMVRMNDGDGRPLRILGEKQALRFEP
jgi:hypothetical protein